MRIIDADELKRKLYEVCPTLQDALDIEGQYEYHKGIQDAIKVIKEMPSFEPEQTKIEQYNESLKKQEIMKAQGNWISCVMDLPQENGLYYVLCWHSGVDNLEMYHSNFEDGIWDLEKRSDDMHVLQWKQTKEKTILNEKEWLIEHKKQIEKAFNISFDKMVRKVIFNKGEDPKELIPQNKIEHFAVYETFESCFIGDPLWFEWDVVKAIDGMYVVHWI